MMDVVEMMDEYHAAKLDAQFEEARMTPKRTHPNTCREKIVSRTIRAVELFIPFLSPHFLIDP